MIKNIRMVYDLVNFKLIDGKKTYWVTLIKDNKKKDIGCFTFKDDVPDINQIFIFIGDELRFKKSKKWNDFFDEKELIFLEKLSASIVDINFIFDDLCISKSKLNNERVSFGESSNRTNSVIGLLKTL